MKFPGTLSFPDQERRLLPEPIPSKGTRIVSQTGAILFSLPNICRLIQNYSTQRAVPTCNWDNMDSASKGRWSTMIEPSTKSEDTFQVIASRPQKSAMVDRLRALLCINVSASKQPKMRKKHMHSTAFSEPEVFISSHGLGLFHFNHKQYIFFLES